MVMSFNPDLFLRIQRFFKNKGDYVDNEFEVIGSVDIKPIIRLVHNSTSASGGNILYTTSTEKDTYIVGFSYSETHNNAVTDGTTIGITALDEETGVTRYLFGKTIVTGAVGDTAVSQSFGYPLKLKRGSNTIISGTYAAGVVYQFATIYFYEE